MYDSEIRRWSLMYLINHEAYSDPLQLATFNLHHAMPVYWKGSCALKIRKLQYVQREHCGTRWEELVKYSKSVGGFCFVRVLYELQSKNNLCQLGMDQLLRMRVNHQPCVYILHTGDSIRAACGFHQWVILFSERVSWMSPASRLVSHATHQNWLLQNQTHCFSVTVECLEAVSLEDWYINYIRAQLLVQFQNHQNRSIGVLKSLDWAIN